MPEPRDEQPSGGAPAELDAEDVKLVTLARAALARTGAVAAAAVREDTGRTYVAAAVNLRALQLSALDAVVAAAVASGARALEAAALVTSGPTPAAEEIAAAVEMAGPGARLVVADPRGQLRVVLPLED